MNTVPSREDVVLTMEEVVIGSLHQPRAKVIEEVNWQVRRGEFWVVAGHHGTGKSDLLLTAAGLMGALGGGCRLFGQEMPGIEGARLAARLKAGLVFSDARLLNHLTLGGNVRLPLCYHRGLDETQAARAVQPLLEATGLLRLADRAPGSLGRQWHLRAALARALVLGPELLLLDEPLAGLDTRQANWWVEFLRKWHRGELNLQTSSTAQSVDSHSALCTPHSALPNGLTIVVASGTLDPWRDLATHWAALEEHHLHVLGSLPRAVESGEVKLREFTGFGRTAFDPPGPI